MKYKKILLFSIIIFSMISSSFFISNTKAISDINFTFDQNIIFDDTIDSYNTSNPLGMDEPYNLRYQEHYTGLYNATYSFTNETIGTNSTNIDYIDTDTITINGGFILIESLTDRHSNILNITTATTFDESSNFFEPQTSGTIEFWIRLGSNTVNHALNIRSNLTGKLYILWNSAGDVYYHDGALQDTGENYLADTWYHYRITFDCATDTFDLYINNYLILNNAGFIAVATTLNQLNFGSDNSAIVNILLDGIGFSLDSFYIIGSNLFPFLNKSTTLMEVDKYEFALNDIHTFNELFTDDYINSGWNDLSEGGGITIIDEDIDASYDRVIKYEGASINDVAGIEKDNIGISGNLINISFGFYSTIFDGTTNVLEIRVYSSDNQQITGITIYADLKVKYRDDIGFVDTNIDLILNERIEFNLFINYELNTVFFIYKREGIVVGNFDYPTILENKEGLKKINWKSFNYQNENIKNYIDFIGIYSNGKSQVGKGIDFGIALIDIENVWNRGNYNLFNFIGNGTFHIASTSLYYYYGRSTPPIKETTTYYNEIQLINVYDASIIHLFTGIVVLTVLGNNFNFSYLKIDGVILNESSNSYNLIFEHSGVDITESYFYVDNNNKLQFTHISNDTDTEYIQARFNINDTSSIEARISFRSLINNNARGFFRINYTTTSDFIPFPFVQSSTNVFLSQGKVIRDLIIIISDLDVDTVIGLTSGFVDNIKLLFLKNIQISVITLSLIGMIVPLIIILTPTVALRDLYGESFVIPIFLLMSLILVIGGIIPIWLFFIIAISSSLFLLKKNVQRDD